MLDDSTICAIATPAGSGAIAMVRLSGKDTYKIAGKLIRFQAEKKDITSLPPNTIHLADITNEGELIDDVMVSLYRAPRSYTGEDMIEISCHGAYYIQQKILEALVKSGARLAEPGEFTLRAFLNGKMDLSQAEAVADLIASTSAASHKVAMNQMRGGFSSELSKLREQLLNFISLIELELDFSERTLRPLIDMVIADPLDKDLMEWIRVVEERDESTSLNRLLLTLFDRVAAMEELQPGDLDMNDPVQKEVWLTYQVLMNKVIYTDAYLRA